MAATVQRVWSQVAEARSSGHREPSMASSFIFCACSEGLRPDVRHVQNFECLSGNKIAEIFVELSMGDCTMRTQRVFATSSGEAYFHRRFTLNLAKRPLGPVTVRVVDYRLGETGKLEIPVERIRYYGHWDIYTPTSHWKFSPKSAEISRRSNDETPKLWLNHKLCELEYSVVIDRRRRVFPKLYRMQFLYPVWTAAIPEKITRKSLPFHRLRRWTLRDNSVQEILQEPGQTSHNWTVHSLYQNIDAVSTKRGLSKMDRRNPNRRAFLRLQSQTNPVSILSSPYDVKAGGPKISLGGFGMTSLFPSTSPSNSGSGRNSQSLLAESVNRRFIGKDRSLTNILDAARTETHNAKRVMVWQSLPNLVVETDAHNDVLGEILTHKTDYFHLSGRPVIKKVDPDRISTHGETKITITGDNLGISRDDIAAVLVGGLNCVDSVEYLSRLKIRVTAREFLPGRGSVEVVTKSGGRSYLVAAFEFYDPMTLKDLQARMADRETHVELSLFEKLKQREAVLQEHVAEMIKTSAQHEVRNALLKEYLTELENTVAEYRPDILHLYQTELDTLMHHNHYHHRKAYAAK